MRFWPLAVCLLLLGGSVHATETTTFVYDALGRLSSSTISGGPAAGVQSTTSFDPAGNRTNYSVTGAVLSFAIADASITEGGNLVFTVTRTGTPQGALTVNYATSNGTAIAGSDYTAASGTLTFQTSDVTKTITVATTNDTTAESNETLLVTLSSPSGGATLADAQATGTIIDNDAPAVSFAISSATAVTEGGALVYTVTKTGATSSSLSVNYATANASATAGSDYTAASGTLTFAANETSKTVSVATINDSTNEPAETVLVNLSGATGGATLSDSQGSGTINDNDPAPAFAISNAAAVTEGGALVYTVTKAGSTSSSYSVNYATANGSATAGSDYTATSGTLTFTSTQTSKTISVSTTDDSTTESAETVLVNLSGATGGATISDSQGSGTINDNDGVITLTDSNLNVLATHTSTYTCQWVYAPEWGVDYRYCSLISNGYTVFTDNWGAQTFDPGYSMTSNYVLKVTSAAYGTGTSP